MGVSIKSDVYFNSSLETKLEIAQYISFSRNIKGTVPVVLNWRNSDNRINNIKEWTGLRPSEFDKIRMEWRELIYSSSLAPPRLVRLRDK